MHDQAEALVNRKSDTRKTQADSIDLLRNIGLIILILLPAPYVRGAAYFFVPLVRFFILLVFALSVMRSYFLRKTFVAKTDRSSIKIPIAFFLVYLIYLFSQIYLFKGDLWAGVQQLFYMLFFLVCLDYFSRKEKVNTVILLLSIEISALVLMGYYGRWSLEQLERTPTYYSLNHVLTLQSRRTFMYHNAYGGFTALAAPLLLGNLIYWIQRSRSGKKRLSYGTETIFYILVLIFTAISLLHAKDYDEFVMELLVIAFCLCIGLVSKTAHRLQLIAGVFVAFILFISLLSGTNLSMAKLLYGFLLKHYESFKIHLGNSMAIFCDHPIFGAGSGVYNKVLKARDLGGAANITGIQKVASGHLELLVDTGIAGYLLFAFPIALVVVNGLKRSLSSPSLWCRSMGMASFVGITVYVILSIFNSYSSVPSISILFILHLAILQKCGTIYQDKDFKTSLTVSDQRVNQSG